MTNESTPASRSRLFRRVYQESQRTLRELLRPVLATLESLGCGPDGTLAQFEPKVRQVVAGFAHDPPSARQFAALRVSPTPQVRQRLIVDFLTSLGVPPEGAASGAQLMMSISREQMLQTGPTWDHPSQANTPEARVFVGLRATFRAAKRLHERLRELQRRVNEPYRGDIPARSSLRGRSNSPAVRRGQARRFADRGVEQTVDLLKMFPDIADGVYQRCGLSGIHGFPPQTRGPVEGDAGEFVAHVEAHLEDEATWAIVSCVAMLAAGVVLTVVTAGVAGPLVGMAVGAGVGVAQGGLHVANTTSDLAVARDGRRIGAVSEERLAFLEGEVQGAWGMLLVDVATGGVLGRFGGAGNAGRLVQAFRTMAISGAGSGLGTATNPNVWDAPDVAGVLLKATVIGAVAGVAGSTLGQMGTRLMIGLGRGSGALRPGAVVTLSARDAPAGGQLRGEVIAVDGQNVRIATPHGEVTYRVDDVAIMRTADGSPAETVSQTRRATSRRQIASDRAPRVETPEATGFDRVGQLESAALRDRDALGAMSPEALQSMSETLMPRVQAEMAGLGYRTRPVTVTNESGGQHMALELLEAPGRMGTLIRRAGPAMGSDVRYIYDPIGLRRDGGAGLFDAELNAMRIGHSMMAYGHRGVMTPFFHELRHGRTMVRLGDSSYPFHGKLFFGERSEMSIVSSEYRDQFQIDEMYAYLRQAGSSNLEAARANQIVADQGLGARTDRRIEHSFGHAHGEGEAYRARDFARATKQQVGEMDRLLNENLTRVTTKVEATDGGRTTIHTFVDAAGKPVLKVEYFHDGRNTVALVVKEELDGGGRPVDETHVVLYYELPNVPAGYVGDATHSHVVSRMRATLAATDDVIARAMGLRDAAIRHRDEAREIFAR